MEHRQSFRSPPVFDTDHDQNMNHQSSMHLGNAANADGGSFAFNTENMLPGDTNICNWNSALQSNEYAPISINMELTHHHMPMPGPSYLPFHHPSAARIFCPVAPNYTHYGASSSSHYGASSSSHYGASSSSHYGASSSNHHGHLIHGYEDEITNAGNGRVPNKRKRTSVPTVHKSVNGYHCVGSSSGQPNSFPVKPNSGLQHWPWEVVSVTPSNRGSNLIIPGEASQRSVRSRSSLDLDVNQARSHLLSNLPRYSNSTGRLMNRPTALDPPNLGVSANTHEWRHIPCDAPSRIFTGHSSFRHGSSQFHLGSTSTEFLEMDSYHPSLISSRNYIIPPPNSHISGSQAIRGAQSSYVQRAIPACRVTRGYQHFGHGATSSERVVQPLLDSYSSAYSRPLSMIGWRSSDRSGRLRIPYQRPSPLSGVADAHDRLGFMMDHSTFYDPRNLLDQHRDMRLDVDNMSYEELLALEERIGDVSTGLSEDMMLNCLRESVYYPSEQTQEESSCVICLEEYKNKDVVATLVSCNHNYHTSCIKQWLSIKKVCPICKAPVLTDC